MADRAVRVDKFLTAARFFKTRAIAAQAISAGKVEVNGVRAKPAKSLTVGDRLRVRKGPYEFLVTVRLLSDRRGPPATAVALYQEDPAGKAIREKLAHQLRIAPTPTFEGRGRPTKRDRRELDRLRDDDGD
ncbi:MAG TPA: RNA-binding S4 domain-containing protein [Gemmatimonadales bacterium]|jgi:ribosome-associated heat shock protein Hsp15